MKSPDFSLLGSLNIGLPILLKHIHNKAVSIYGPVYYEFRICNLGTDAGCYLTTEKVIVINSRMIRTRPFESIQTFVHELSHAICVQKFGDYDHSETWINVGYSLGYSLSVFHNYKL